MELRRYDAADKDRWNRFVAESKNGFFMFDRDYMDYHSDRFVDHSLLFYEGDELCAVLPANEQDGVLYSHQGLTFGGVLSGRSMRAERMLDAFKALTQYLQRETFIKMEHKAIPYIYHSYPAQEDLYALFRHNARISRVDASTAILLATPYSLNKGKKASVAKARRNGVEIRENDSLDEYFSLLNTRLGERYSKSSTHTAAEMVQLQAAFPENILLYTAHVDGRMVAGVLIYLSSQVLHVQYIGALDEGLRLGANEMILAELMERYRDRVQYFDFGISNENRGAFLNTGLVAQKEHFGGRTIVHQFYELNI